MLGLGAVGVRSGRITLYVRVYTDDECPVLVEVSAACVRIANPPSTVRLRPEPLSVKPLRCADNSGHRAGFLVLGSLAGWSLGSESGASQFAHPATACPVLPEFVLAGVSTGSRASPTPAIIKHPRASRKIRGRSWGCWLARRSSVRHGFLETPRTPCGGVFLASAQIAS